jgi:hypothetical protein
MAVDSQLANFNGMFKQRYGDEVLNLVPESALLVREIPFEARSMEGAGWNVPVVLADEQGMAYGDPNAGNFTLAPPISFRSQNALVDGYQQILAGSLDYNSAARSMHGEGASFVALTKYKVENIINSARKRLEASVLYGQSGLGVVSAVAATDSTHTYVTLSAASFAPLLWAGKENACVVFYDPSTGAGNYTRIGSEPSLPSLGAYQITSVDILNRSFTVVSTSGDATSLTGITLGNNIVVYYWLAATGSTSSFSNQDMMGLDQQLVSTATRFGIDPTLYSLWAGNTYNCSAQAFTFKKIQDGIAIAVGRGGLDEDIDVFVNPNTWSNLLTDLAALRKIDSSYDPSKLENGAKAIEFYSQSGKVRVRSHGVVKAGEAFGFPMRKLSRVGAYDLSFTRPGGGDAEGDIWFDDPTRAGYLMRTYAHQAVLLLAPAKAIKWYNIVNS